MELERITELTRVAYNRIAQKYHECFREEMLQKPYDRRVLDEFSDSLPENSLICDAGCGPSGHIGQYLHDRGHRITGIDISERCIEMASHLNPAMTFQVMDMMNTDFDADSFDGLIAFYSIIYTPREHAPGLFGEFHRILKPGGKLLVVVKKGEQEGLLNDEWYEGTEVYFTHFLEADLTGYCRLKGLTVLSVETRCPYPFEIAVDRIYLSAAKPRTPELSVRDVTRRPP